ncbi:O-antigen ligase family protein [Clostridium beijerinckii]|jgi:O-antigen ligase|uniref:O-antigen ligase family protein n=1 Tax=Clostridium beijerinckii TaxID=1520 RepID=A0AAW3W9X5_CLOBE|nr:O-antigen ligase family protein [Clostridium beijerinckii]MBC2457710.1 O-antigen ligase family protein [Clostridium beijerinckii]MBC2475642.1 O-antigen ligase family protein [Clostridium beijerinckii]MCI1477277.1 O-antigen ligase family protein [Clostridium beijerinckii]MCI1577102.1 O-antigen ligase family protein [Clostridium beijerinckii]MCI1584056.1 O-antigen ligase family protein [Clostridium beijerinckii]
MREAIKKIYDFLDNKFYFKLLYLFVSLTFVTMLKYVPGRNILNAITLAWGMLLILFMVIEGYKRRKIYKFDIPLALFMILTLIFNIFIYRSIDNIKVWIVNLIIFVVIFTVDVFKSKKKLIKELNIITYSYVIFMMVASIISLIMRYSGINIEIGQVAFGSTKGVFENENALSIATSLAIVMCVYLNYISRSHKLKMLWMGNIILQAVTMIGSHGRSAYLVIIAVIYLSIFIYSKNKYIRVALVLVPILFCGVFFEMVKSHLEAFTTERNIIWTSASVVIEKNPLTGVGNSNLIEAVRNARIGSYLPGIEFGGMHNIYVQIAAVNGLISLLLFLMFIAMIVVFIVQHLDKLNRREKNQMTIITSIIAGILAVNLFESVLIYTISFISMIFWIYLGYLVSLLDNKNID